VAYPLLVNTNLTHIHFKKKLLPFLDSGDKLVVVKIGHNSGS
jgi:hypothetical protein